MAGESIENALWRGSVAWPMQVIDVQVGHRHFGFEYPMSGDARPASIHKQQESDRG
jgi:hypothetical protein